MTDPMDFSAITQEQAVVAMDAVMDLADGWQTKLNAATVRIGDLTIRVTLGEIDDREAAIKAAEYLQTVKQCRTELRLHDEAYKRLYAIWSERSAQ